MSKFRTRFINYSDRSFKKKFDDLIFYKRKFNNEINTTVTKILKEIVRVGKNKSFINLASYETHDDYWLINLAKFVLLPSTKKRSLKLT